MQDKFIENTLDTDQKNRFKHLQWLRCLQKEFFIINETLFPDKTQTYRIKNILDEYRKKAHAMMALRKSMAKGKGSGTSSGGGKGGNGMRGGGNRGGEMRGGKRGGGQNRMGRTQDMEKSNPMDSLNSEKYKKIKKLLTESQKKWFTKVKKILKLENKLRREARFNRNKR